MGFGQHRTYLEFFYRVGLVYQKMYADPLWTCYPKAATSDLESLGVFLEGYAFERQGRNASFSAAAADVIKESSSFPLDPADVWKRFRGKMDNAGLNVKNNPLAPKGTPFSKGSGKTWKYSAVELANEIGVPLVEWVVCGLRENRTQQVHAEICKVTGVGPKIASFFLRDVACRYQTFPSESRELLQPVDIWVKRSALLLGVGSADTAKFIVEQCQGTNSRPEEVNQGMWYFGSQIAASDYQLRKCRGDLAEAEGLLARHLKWLQEAAGALRACTQAQPQHTD
jgi:hypothetical protein